MDSSLLAVIGICLLTIYMLTQEKWLNGGKGSRPRAKSPDKWDVGWERIFNKAKTKIADKKIKKKEK